MMKDKITVKEIAEMLNVSKTTVQRAIKELELTPDIIVKNRHLYCPESAKEIIEFIDNSFDVSQVFNFKTETKQNETEQNKDDTKAETVGASPPQSDDFRHSITTEYIETLKEQIKQKDMMIADLLEQNKMLVVSNARITKALEDKSGEDENIINQPEKRWFQFWKK